MHLERGLCELQHFRQLSNIRHFLRSLTSGAAAGHRPAVREALTGIDRPVRRGVDSPLIFLWIWAEHGSRRKCRSARMTST